MLSMSRIKTETLNLSFDRYRRYRNSRLFAIASRSISSLLSLFRSIVDAFFASCNRISSASANITIEFSTTPSPSVLWRVVLKINFNFLPFLLLRLFCDFPPAIFRRVL